MKKELLTCCRTPQELEQVRIDVENGDHRSQYLIQSNLLKEKTGYRCTNCGAFYPFLEIHHGGRNIDPKSISKPLGRRLKYKKAASVFRGNHYFATNKKTLLRFDIDETGNGTLADETPIMGQVSYVTVSPDGRYIATENFSNAVAIVDATTKETIAKKRNLPARGSFRFVGSHSLVYFRLDDGLYRWDFLEDREILLWQPPENWRLPNYRPTVYCSAVLEPEKERLVYQLGAGAWTFALILEKARPVDLIRLPDTHNLTELTYSAGRYTLPVGDRVLVYDGDFRPIDEFAYPQLVKRLDGGGVFPIDTFTGSAPQRVHLSPDGKWVLFDFFNYLLLMDRDTGALRYCVYSYTGTTSTGSGFLDDTHIWYNWADSTYIMELK